MSGVSNFNQKDLQALQYLTDLKVLLSGNDWYVPFLEIHPTDYCNLHCNYCTFKESQHRDLLPFNSIDSISELRPKTIVISGGGEPTLYNYCGMSLADYIIHLHNNLPKARIGMKTNGQIPLKGEALGFIEKIRISINAGNADTFKQVTGGTIDKCFETFVFYLEQGITKVSIGYLFNDENISEIISFLYRLREVQLFFGDDFDRRVDVQFRPTCKISSCNCQSSNYQNTSIMVSDMSKEWCVILDDIKDSLFSNPMLIPLLKCTNLNRTSLFDYKVNNDEFSNCYLSLIQMYIRANGDIYPCCQLASSRENSIGNILNDPTEVIRARQFEFWTKYSACKNMNNCCKLVGRKNVLFDNAINFSQEYVDVIPQSLFI